MRNVPAEALLLRWMNWHLERAGYQGTVTNFQTDLVDSSAYLHLLHALNPQVVPTSALDSALELPDRLDRADRMLVLAAMVDDQARTFLQPEDVLAGREKLNLCFLANLFNKCTGMAELHEELETKNLALEDTLKQERVKIMDLTGSVERLNARIQELEEENRDLKAKLLEKEDVCQVLRVEKVTINENFSTAVKHWKEAQGCYEKELNVLQSQVCTYSVKFILRSALLTSFLIVYRVQ